MINIDVRFVPPITQISAGCTEAEKILAVQMEKDTRPYVPALTMSLNQRTHVIGNHVIYPGPYSRYLWAGKVMVDSVTGKGPAKIPEVGYRFRKGATLVPTSRPMQYTKSVHPLATDHWTEASTQANLDKWKRVAKRAVATYGR